MPRVLLPFVYALAAVLAVGALPAQSGAALGSPGRPWLLSVRSSGAEKAVAQGGGSGTFIVVLGAAPLASYVGGLPGLAATSALARGEPRLASASPAAVTYLRYLEAQQAAAHARIDLVLGRHVALGGAYRYVLNGLALDLSSAEAELVARLPGVRLVQRDEPGRPLTDVGPALIGAAQADLRPAILYAQLGAVAPGAGATGRAVASYSAATARLAITVTATGLAAAPSAARLVLASPDLTDQVIADLTPLRVPGAAAFAGDLALAAAEAALLRGEIELVVATDGEPAGALRGPLLPARGEGVIAGVVDTGVNPFAPSFAEVGADGYAHVNPLGPNVYRGVCDPESSSYLPAFPCNAKLIGAYPVAGTWAAPDPAGRPSPFDDEGHGSHTAAIVAGNLVERAELSGVSLGPLAGVAPHSALIAYDACSFGLCSTQALLAVIDRAVADGAAVINFSIGSTAEDPWRDAVALALLGALEAGTLSAASAGNEGPSAASISSPANAPWVLAVGAASHGRRVTRVLGDFSGGAGAPPSPLPAQGLGTTVLTSLPIVSAGAYLDSSGRPNDSCGAFASGVRLDGAIVVCRQKGLAQVSVNRVFDVGGSAAVIIWPELAGRQLLLEDEPMPVVHLDAAAGAALLAWLGSGTGHQASLGAAAPDRGGPANTVAWFSSRGPDRLNPDLIKPDLAAPGLNVLAAYADNNPGQPDYALLSGTSMAAPHAAGAAALLRQIHPAWTPAELRSALVTTASPALRLADEQTVATPHDAGAGLVRVDLAARAGLLLDETAAGFRAADPAEGGDPALLNLAGLSRGVCLGQCVFTRTVRSALDVSATWAAVSQGSPGLSLEVRPARFTLGPGAAQTVVITAEVARSAAAPAGPYLYGEVRFEEAAGLAPPARLPAAVRARASLLPAEVTIRTRFPTGSTETPALRSITADGLTARVLGLTRPSLTRISLGEDRTWRDPFDGSGGVYTTTLALPAGSARLYVAVDTSTAQDIDLMIFADGEGGPLDNEPQVDELICISAGVDAAERCDLLLEPGPARQMIVLVQNFLGSGATLDSVDLAINVVPGVSAGNMTAVGPAAVAAGEAYTLWVDWSLVAGPKGAGRYQGVLELSSGGDPAMAGDLGWIPVDLTYSSAQVYLPQVDR